MAAPLELDQGPFAEIPSCRVFSFLYLHPDISLTFPFWLAALPSPICVFSFLGAPGKDLNSLQLPCGLFPNPPTRYHFLFFLTGRFSPLSVHFSVLISQSLSEFLESHSNLSFLSIRHFF